MFRVVEGDVRKVSFHEDIERKLKDRYVWKFVSFLNEDFCNFPQKHKRAKENDILQLEVIRSIQFVFFLSPTCGDQIYTTKLVVHQQSAMTCLQKPDLP